MNRLSLASILLSIAASSVLAADQPSPAELKMRESLRNTMMQLRTAETERANLQAAQAELEQKNKTLATQVEALTKQAAEDKAKADKTTADLTDKVAARDTEIVQYKETIEKWKTEFVKLSEVAKTKESERARLEAKSIALDRQVADQFRKNEAMYKLGTEILSRYEKFGLGEALTAREPFVGITRVKFENLMQDYSDKLNDNRIKPPAAPAPAAKPAAKKEKAAPARPAKTEKPTVTGKPAGALS